MDSTDPVYEGHLDPDKIYKIGVFHESNMFRWLVVDMRHKPLKLIDSGYCKSVQECKNAPWRSKKFLNALEKDYPSTIGDNCDTCNRTGRMTLRKVLISIRGQVQKVWMCNFCFMHADPMSINVYSVPQDDDPHVDPAMRQMVSARSLTSRSGPAVFRVGDRVKYKYVSPYMIVNNVTIPVNDPKEDKQRREQASGYWYVRQVDTSDGEEFLYVSRDPNAKPRTGDWLGANYSAFTLAN